MQDGIDPRCNSISRLFAYIEKKEMVDLTRVLVISSPNFLAVA